MAGKIGSVVGAVVTLAPDLYSERGALAAKLTGAGELFAPEILASKPGDTNFKSTQEICNAIHNNPGRRWALQKVVSKILNSMNNASERASSASAEVSPNKDKKKGSALAIK